MHLAQPNLSSLLYAPQPQLASSCAHSLSSCPAPSPVPSVLRQSPAPSLVPSALGQSPAPSPATSVHFHYPAVLILHLQYHYCTYSDFSVNCDSRDLSHAHYSTHAVLQYSYYTLTSVLTFQSHTTILIRIY